MKSMLSSANELSLKSSQARLETRKKLAGVATYEQEKG